jgi:hypothetical protein
MPRYLRNKKDGFIYEWDAILDKNPSCEEVSEEEAFPEKFLKPAVVEKVKRGRKKKGELNLSTDDIPEEPLYTSPELAADASRRLP